MSAQVSYNMATKQVRYEALVKALHSDLFRYAYWLCHDKHVSEDLVQETFLRAWRALDSLKDEKAAKSWLITILRRENARRFERKRFNMSEYEEATITDTQSVTTEQELENHWLREKISQLPPEYSEPLVLQVLGGFSGEDVEIKAFYTDPAGIKNFYFFEFLPDFTPVPDLEIYKDEFTDGNQIFGFYDSEDIEAGDDLRIRIHGVSERFYDFMFILLQQGNDAGGPFETQPATVRGNCTNKSNPNNFPFGYFRLSEVDEVIYTVQ